MMGVPSGVAGNAPDYEHNYSTGQLFVYCESNTQFFNNGFIGSSRFSR
jgi:hypothetical protein